jgi:ABC-type sulfate/molybdate transport systems ATPase subunit
VSRLEATVHKRLGALALEVEIEVGEETLAVVGPNGAGKTTLLLAMLGIVRPDAGRVALDGRVLFEDGSGADVLTEDRRIAYVPQDYGLFPHLTAGENVEFALGCRRPAPPARDRRDRGRGWLERLGALGYADRRPGQLSGGERQRVALARALATDPRALLFDEPFASLDVEARSEVRGFLRKQLAELALPAIVVTHDPADVEALGATVLVLEAGRAIQRGTLAELWARPASEYVTRFASGAPFRSHPTAAG